MSDLTNLTLESALNGMASGDFSSEELTKAHVEACMEAADLNAFITTTFEQALDQAKASDDRRAKGEVGRLEGAPLGVKDLFCTKGVKTTAGSNILGDFTPPYESTVSANMKRDGMVMLGKLNLDEFAMGSSNETSAYGSVVNPWKNGEELVPGGSSGVLLRLWRLIFAWAQLQLIPAAPFANLRHLRARLELNRPMAAAHVGVLLPSPARWIRQARLPKPSKTALYCLKAWPDMIRKTAPRSTLKTATGKVPAKNRSRV